jgi:hypothetical protein
MNTINLKLGINQNAEVELAQKEITLMIGANTGKNIHASLVHAERLLHNEKAGKVLYINTVQTPWKLAESARKAVPEAEERYIGDYYLHGKDIDHAEARLFFMSSELGELPREKERILELCRKEKIQTIIINSWECAAPDARVRDKLLFLLRGFNRGDKNPQIDYKKVHAGTDDSWMVYDYFPATILIYAEPAKTEDVVPGKIHRRGLGKLMIIADQFIQIPSEEQSEVRGTKSEVKSSIVDSQLSIVKEKEIPIPILTIDHRPSTIDVPVTSIEQLRTTPAPLAKMSIHQNGYSPDKSPVRQTDLHSDVIRK